jgi:hypothetical protein
MEFGYCDSHLSVSVSFSCLPFTRCWINTGTVRETVCNVMEQMMDNVAINPVLLGLNICATVKKLQSIHFIVMTGNFNVQCTLLMFVPYSGIWPSLLLVINIFGRSYVSSKCAIVIHCPNRKTKRSMEKFPFVFLISNFRRVLYVVFWDPKFVFPECMLMHAPLHDTDIRIPIVEWNTL